jgi:glutamate racemase
MRIGVFDSGIGGEAVAASLRRNFPTCEVMRVSDQAHVPYGTRSPAEILRLTTAAIQPLIQADCDAIVIACNTATAAALPQLRLDFPDELFIGFEPMIKPAVRRSKTKVVAVFATPATLASSSYKRLKLLHGARVNFVEPDCSDWASLIESNDMNREHIDSVVEYCLSEQADVIVLACTHYHWISEEIQAACGDRAVVIEPTKAIVQRVRDLLVL